MRELAPNILAGKIIYVRMKLGKRYVACILSRVYYRDTPRERRIWVDVEVIDTFYTQKQRSFLHIAMENLHYSHYSKIVALSFQQEELDIAHRVHLKDDYACHIDLRLTQERETREGYYWQGVLGVCERPKVGQVFVRGNNTPIYNFAYVCITPFTPLSLCVKYRNRIKIESKVIIKMGYSNIPCVLIEGAFMYITVHIGGQLYSGRNDAQQRIASLKRIEEYGSPTAAL